MRYFYFFGFLRLPSLYSNLFILITKLIYYYLDFICLSGVFSTVVKCKNFSSSGGAMVAVKVILLLTSLSYLGFFILAFL
jgi:hypothetical protein